MKDVLYSEERVALSEGLPGCSNSGWTSMYSDDGASERLLTALEHEIKMIQKAMRDLFNPHFGSVFRTALNPTLFGFSVMRYCDLYVPSLADCRSIANFSERRFYPTATRSMPHEPTFSRAAIVGSLRSNFFSRPPEEPWGINLGTEHLK